MSSLANSRKSYSNSAGILLLHTFSVFMLQFPLNDLRWSLWKRTTSSDSWYSLSLIEFSKTVNGSLQNQSQGKTQLCIGLLFSNLRLLVLSSTGIWFKTHNALLLQRVINHKHTAIILHVKEWTLRFYERYVFNRQIQVSSGQNTPIMAELHRKRLQPNSTRSDRPSNIIFSMSIVSSSAGIIFKKSTIALESSQLQLLSSISKRSVTVPFIKIILKDRGKILPEMSKHGRAWKECS